MTNDGSSYTLSQSEMDAYKAAMERQAQKDAAQAKIKSTYDNFYNNLKNQNLGDSFYNLEYDTNTGELTQRGQRQVQGYQMAKSITGQEVGQSGIDMQKIKQMREAQLGANSVDSNLAARASGDKIAKLQNKAGMSGVDVAGMVSDSARRGQMEASAINQRAQASALDKFAQNVMSMAGINLSTIQGYENLGESEKPLPVANYDSGGIFG